MWTGQYVQTYTSQAIQWVAEEAGASSGTACNIGEVGNGIIGFAGTLGAGIFNDAKAGSWALNGMRGLLGGGLDAVGEYVGAVLNAPNGSFYSPYLFGYANWLGERLAYAQRLVALASDLQWLEDGGVMFRGRTVQVTEDLTHIPDWQLLEIAETGKSPMMGEGQVITLHHVGQAAEGDLWELASNLNDISNLELHPFGNTAGMGHSAGERIAFASWRNAYWQSRAADEMLRRWGTW